MGLAVGIAVCALILLWIRDGLSYDRFHEKADRTYRVMWDARLGNNEWTLAKTPIPLAGVLREEVPEVENVVRFTTATRTLRLGSDWVNEQSVLRVDHSFFDVFTVSFLAGSPETALQSPNSAVLTGDAARRYFADRDPMGQTIEVNNGDVLQVTGVIESFPPQSHFHFDFLLPLAEATFLEWQRAGRSAWGTPPVYTYFILREGAQASEVSSKLERYIQRTIVPESSWSEGDNFYGLPLQRLTDIHLRSHVSAELASNGNVIHIYVFSLIAFFILLLACVNFINLATARAANRALEVGIRKAIGSRRAQLVCQFLAESAVYVAFAVILAIALIAMALPAFNSIAGKDLETDYLGSPFFLLVLLGIAAAVTLLAGAYPAFILSSFRPALALKGPVTAGRGRNWLRSGLVVAQFCISIGLIAGTLIVSSQLDYVQNKQLGFDKEHVLIVESAGALGTQHHAFRERLGASPLVVTTSSTQSLPGRPYDSTVFEPEQPAGFSQSSVNYSWVDEGYVDVLNLHIVKGRNFSSGRSADSSAFLINQAAADVLGWDDPVGKTLSMGSSSQGPVIGVVENFHYESLHKEIEPLFLPFMRWTPSNVAVRFKRGTTGDAVAAVQQIWDDFMPQQPFTYSFLDQDYERLYRSEQQVAGVFGMFSGLALFIACLGLFGLASYMALRRTKEIGIRKVLGASAGSVTILLTREFAVLVVIAFLVAAPPAYFGMSRWLESFAYRIDIGPGVFLWSGGTVLLVALLTVSYQAVRAALSDPVKSLRYE